MKVLLAVDGSAQSLAACRYLTGFPLPQPLDVEIVTVVNPPDVVLSAQSELWYPQFLEHQEEIARQAIQSSREAIESLEAQVTSHQMMGHIGHQLVQRVEDEDFDLVVVAAKGHSALERMLLGSVSSYVATHAPCSVLVVRPDIPDPEAPASLPPATQTNAGWVRGGIVAVDQREVSEKMMQHLCHYAWTKDHHLTAVTAAVKLEIFREDVLASTMQESQRRQSEAKRCADAAAVRLGACGADASAHTIEVEHIGDGLVQYAKQSDSDLIVIGDSRRGLLSRLLLGSTSRYVLHHVHCSVLVVRNDGNA